MNVGYPISSESPTEAGGVGDAHSSEDTRKGKSGRSEGALLRMKFTKWETNQN